MPTSIAAVKGASVGGLGGGAGSARRRPARRAATRRADAADRARGGTGLASALTAGIAEELRAHLETTFPSVRWAPEILTEHALVIPPAGVAELVEAVRQELLDHEWAICVCVTDLPLYIDGRPIVSHVSVTHGVGIVSLPALGALQLSRRLREQIVEVIAELVCEEPGRPLAGTADWE